MKIKTLLAVFMITIFTLFLGFLLGAWIWSAYPIGNDAISHLAKIKFILDHWPHVRWNHQWAAGMPLFRWYPSLFYLFVAFVSNVTRLPITFVVVLFIAASFCTVGLAVYGLVFEITRNLEVSLIASFLTISTPAIWSQYIARGLYTRVISTPLLPLSLWATAKYVFRKGKKNYVSAILCISLAILIHPYYGMMALLASVLMVFFYIDGWLDKFKYMVKLMLPSLSISSYFLFPYFIPSPPGGTALSMSGTFLPFSTINYVYSLPKWGGDLALQPLLIPLTLGLFLLMFLRKRLKIDRRVAYFTFLSLLILSILSLFDLSKIDMIHLFLTFLTFFLVPVDAIMLEEEIYRRAKKMEKISNKLITFSLLLLIISSTVFFMHINFKQGIPYFKKPGSDPLDGIVSKLKIPDKAYSYRAGVSGGYGGMGQWFNYKYDVPQTRDYGSIFALFQDWHVQFTYVCYSTEDYNDTNFLLDWWAVKWILARNDHFLPGTQTTHAEKFLNKPEFYERSAEADYIYQFNYSATPIVSSTNSPTMLVIGNDIAYRNVFSALAPSGHDSRSVVPIRGKEHINDYTVSELSRFDAIILYGYDYNDPRAWSLLNDYVKNGGGLIIETGYSPDHTSSDAPLCWPVSDTVATDFGMEWNLTSAESPVTKGVNFTGFSPAVYGEHPWGVSASFDESVRPWAKTVLWVEDRPLVVMGEYEKGRVIWSGLNLPYHVISYHNYWESLLLSRMMDWVSRAPERDTSSLNHTVSRPHPEKVIVNVDSEARGVLFKECYFKNWRAYLTDPDGRRQKLSIYLAGPSFMYIDLPRVVDYPIEVVFEYSWGLDVVVWYAVSIVTFIALLIYVARGTSFQVSSIFNPFSWIEKRVKSWWR